MKVKELIEKLEQIEDKDTEILVSNGTRTVHAITEITINKRVMYFMLGTNTPTKREVYVIK